MPPVSTGARVLRVILVVTIDVIMVVAGVLLMRSGLEARSQSRAESAAADATEVLSPRQVPRDVPTGGSVADVARERTAQPVPGLVKEKAPPADRPAEKEAPQPKPAVLQPKPKPAVSQPKPKPEVSQPKPEPDNEPVPTPEVANETTTDVPLYGGESGLEGEPPPASGGGGGEAEGGGAGEGAGEPEAVSTQAPEEEVRRLAGQIGRVVDRNRASLGRCYSRASKPQGENWVLEGQVEIRLTVLPSGAAANVRPVSNDTGSDVLADCLVNLVRSWEFPAHGYDPIDFVWPFVFHPPNQ